MASDANVLTAPGRDIERRNMPTLRFSFALILLLVFAASAGAQSLADVARREDARRKQVRKPSRVLTNKDLKPSETPSPPPPPAEAKAPAKTEAAAPAEPEVTDEEKRQKDEQAWRQRMTDSRQALERIGAALT